MLANCYESTQVGLSEAHSLGKQGNEFLAYHEQEHQAGNDDGDGQYEALYGKSDNKQMQAIAESY